MANKPLTQTELEQKLARIQMVQVTIGSAGFTAGLVYAFMKKKSFWGYVGFGMLGGLVIGGIAAVAMLPVTTKLASDIVAAKDAEGGYVGPM